MTTAELVLVLFVVRVCCKGQNVTLALSAASLVKLDAEIRGPTNGHMTLCMKSVKPLVTMSAQKTAIYNSVLFHLESPEHYNVSRIYH